MTPNERLILAAARNLVTPEGAVSGRDIARATRLRDSTVSDTIRRLADAGAWPYRKLTGAERAAKGARLRAAARRPDADDGAADRIAEIRAEKERQFREAPAPSWVPPTVRISLPRTEDML